MNVQLLLLLALAGPFCALTHASPTALPEDLEIVTQGDITGVTGGPILDLSLVTGPPAATDAAEVAQDQVVTDAAVEAEPEAVTAAPAEAATETPAEAPTVAAPAVVLTEEPVVDTEAPVASTAAAPVQLITEAPAVETAAPAEEAEKEDPHVVPTSPAKVEEEVLYIEVEDGLTSGQVAGIVIGALLAIVILIAVVIAAVRRMGKYSSAKNKRPTKKESVLPLRKKQAKQQERAKFWKF
ncbi:podoplanin isoform X2 [Sparus aurata]|uniref:podoplanin isoform X2 n=1 Tax=Sparus aurata TaxID=8175 RepID=UPI0011C16BAC|nr:uncharacterized protein LOC115584867 isoform X2 [Sparus aurata]